MQTYLLREPTAPDILAWREAVEYGAAYDVTWHFEGACLEIEIEVRLGGDINRMPSELARRYCRVLKLIVA